MMQIYMDYAAATPLDPEVLRAMQPYFTDKFYNPSATYLAAKEVRASLEGARADVASCLGAKPAEIIFTAGATEANNLAIQGIMSRNPDKEILVSAIEHDSVLDVAKQYKYRLIPVKKSGVIDVSSLEKMINSKTAMVSVGLVNNEIGTIQPLRQISSILNNSGILLHTDAAQAANQLDLHISRLGVDLMSLNGGKIYGPKQSGALYLRAGVKLKPIIFGGGQESGFRSGTENVAGAIGFATALKLCQSSRKQQTEKLNSLKKHFISILEKAAPSSIVNGPLKGTANHIVSVSFAGQDNERLMMQLDEAGIQAAVGSACSASNQEPSHVLKAIGLSAVEANSTLRFSFGRQTNIGDIDEAAAELGRLTAV